MNKPFFTNFLEEQDVKKVTGGTLSGSDATLRGISLKDLSETTMKYPSDGDEGAELELF